MFPFSLFSKKKKKDTSLSKLPPVSAEELEHRAQKYTNSKVNEELLSLLTTIDNRLDIYSFTGKQFYYGNGIVMEVRHSDYFYGLSDGMFKEFIVKLGTHLVKKGYHVVFTKSERYPHAAYNMTLTLPKFTDEKVACMTIKED